MVYDHLDGQGVVDVHEEGVHSDVIKGADIHFANGINEGSVILILTENTAMESLLCKSVYRT